MIKTKKIQVEQEVVTSLVCDICHKVVSSSDHFEFQEFFRIDTYGGYGSSIGDGARIQLDMCQDCFKDRLLQYARVGDEQ